MTPRHVLPTLEGTTRPGEAYCAWTSRSLYLQLLFFQPFSHEQHPPSHFLPSPPHPPYQANNNMNHDRSDLKTGFEDLGKVPVGVKTNYDTLTLANKVAKIKTLSYNTPDPSDTSKRVWTTQLLDPKCRKLYDELVGKAMLVNQGMSTQDLFLVQPSKSSDHYTNMACIAGCLRITTTNLLNLLVTDFHATPQGPIFHLCRQEEDNFQIDKKIVDLARDRNAVQWSKFNAVTRETNETREFAIRQPDFQPEITPIPLPSDDAHPKWKGTNTTTTRLLESAVLGVYHIMKTYNKAFNLTQTRVNTSEDQRNLPEHAYRPGLFGFCQDEWYNGWCFWRYAMSLYGKDKEVKKEQHKQDSSKKAGDEKKNPVLGVSYDEAMQHIMTRDSLSRRKPAIDPYYYTADEQRGVRDDYDKERANCNPKLAEGIDAIEVPKPATYTRQTRADHGGQTGDHALDLVNDLEDRLDSTSGKKKKFSRNRAVRVSTDHPAISSLFKSS